MGKMITEEVNWPNWPMVYQAFEFLDPFDNWDSVNSGIWPETPFDIPGRLHGNGFGGRTPSFGVEICQSGNQISHISDLIIVIINLSKRYI
jgi:hypothetical protein